MNKNVLNKIPQGLKKAVEENNLVLFIGSGLSSKFVNNNGQRLGGWENLEKQVVDYIEGSENLKLSVKKGEPYNELEQIEEQMKKSDNYTKIKKDTILYLTKFYTLSVDVNNYNLHKKLCRLSNKIVTTNYDNAFEIADNDFKKNRAIIGNDFALSTLKDTSLKTLLKLHGCISDSNTMVLFPSDYDKLYVNKDINAERILFRLQNLIANKTILFIGCGMGDYQINHIFENVKYLLGEFDKDKHYIIDTVTKLDSKLQGFLELINIDDYTEIPSIIDELLLIKTKLLTKLLSQAKENAQLIRGIDIFHQKGKSRIMTSKEEKAIWDKLPPIWRFFSQYGLARWSLISFWGFLFIAYRSQISNNIPFVIGSLFFIFINNSMTTKLFTHYKKSAKFSDCLGYTLAKWAIAFLILPVWILNKFYNIGSFDFSNVPYMLPLYATIICAVIRIITVSLYRCAKGKWNTLCSTDTKNTLINESILHKIPQEYWTDTDIQKLIDITNEDKLQSLSKALEIFESITPK